MKKLLSILLIGCLLAISAIGCANSKVINGVKYQPYGLVNENDMKSPNIKYRVSIGNVFWGCLFFETIFAPVVIGGWYLYEPIGVADSVPCK